MKTEFPQMVSDKVFCILGEETPYRMIRQSQAVKRADSFRGKFNGKIRWYVPWSADDLALDAEDPAPGIDRFNSVE